MYRPTEILIERGEEEAPVVQRVLTKLPELPVRVVEKDWEQKEARPVGNDPFGAGKRRLFFTRQRARFLEHCPAGTPGLVCCNYLVVSLISNCPMDCSYCFLQEYLANNPTLKVFTNSDDLLDEVAQVVDRQPWRKFRIGTGELSDSLAFGCASGFLGRLGPLLRRSEETLCSNSRRKATVLTICSGSSPADASWYPGA